ncbi:MAG: flavin reductase family protein [Clostridia bacterium]|nr:flavin reductase family protein [Clostridia bacterium]
MSKVVWKGGALLGPLPPVLVTVGDEKVNNVLTVAWTGMISTIPPRTYISVRKNRHSYNILNEKREFVINLTTADMVFGTDYCGIFTGAKVNKFEKCNYHLAPSSSLLCPLIEESPLSLECKVIDVIPSGSHDMFIADIVATDINEELIDKAGKLHLDRANLLAFSHGEYFALGKKLGAFGFSSKKKKKKKKHYPKKEAEDGKNGRNS